MTKILIFELDGELGLFKKFYTTSSLLTFDFPPKTSLIGLIGAILGFKRESKDLIKLQNFRIGIEILNPIHKLHQGVNWLNTKVRGGKDINKATKNQLSEIMEQSSNDAYGFIGDQQYKPTNIQLLVNPKFRIYIEDNGLKYFEMLRKAIINQKYVFSPYLGQTEHIAIINFIDLIEAELINNEDPSHIEEFNCIIPDEYILEDVNGQKAINLENDCKLIIETLPLKYEQNNTVFNKVVYNKERKPLLLSAKSYYIIKSSKLAAESRNIVVY